MKKILLLGLITSSLIAEHVYTFHNNLDKPVYIKGKTFHIGSEGIDFRTPTILAGKSGTEFTWPDWFKIDIENVPWWLGIGEFDVVNARNPREVFCSFNLENLPEFISGKPLGAGFPLTGRLGSMDFNIEKIPQKLIVQGGPICKIRVYPTKDRNTLGTRTCTVFDKDANSLGEYTVFALDYPGSCSCDEEGNPFKNKCAVSTNETAWKTWEEIVKIVKQFLEKLKK